MNILIIGNGSREHALAWKIKRSPKVSRIFVAPGNGGTEQIAINVPISTTSEIINWLKKNPVDLVVVGPDNYLEEGIVDQIESMNIPVFGPTRPAAEIEWSKAFAKQFMKEEGIPSAVFEVFSDYDDAVEYVRALPLPIVIKASGLAAGKGVIIAETIEEAESTLHEILEENKFGNAGNTVIVEEFLIGKEISIHAFCDGKTSVLFPAAQDHKRIFDNDKGPNTGGMGTIAPVPWVTQEMMDEIKQKIVDPTLVALMKRGRPFKGVLFPGIMITGDGPKVIEFNARFGDPETQSYMRILKTDLFEVLLSCTNGTLDKQKITWTKEYACCVVCASLGYPGEYQKGKVISGLEVVKNKYPGVEVFHAGTRIEDGKTITNGGRVLGVTATADTLKDALAKAYEATNSISFEGMQYRKDIGKKSL